MRVLRLFVFSTETNPFVRFLRQRDDPHLPLAETIKLELDGTDSKDPIQRTSNVYASNQFGIFTTAHHLGLN